MVIRDKIWSADGVCQQIMYCFFVNQFAPSRFIKVRRQLTTDDFWMMPFVPFYSKWMSHSGYDPGIFTSYYLEELPKEELGEITKKVRNWELKL